MEENKPIMFEFKPDIYPYRFWLVVNEEFSVVEKYFKYPNDKVIDDIEGSDYDALTLTVKDKEGYYGSVIYFHSYDRMLNEVIAHECFHAIVNLFKRIDEPNGGEPFAYMLEWLFRKCEEVKLNNIS